MLPHYQDGTLFSEAGTWGRREVVGGGDLGVAGGGRGLADRRRRSRLHLVRLSRDQRRPALILENSSESRNRRLRRSRAKRRRSRCNLSCVLALPVPAGWCRAKFLSACPISASTWTRARWR